MSTKRNVIANVAGRAWVLLMNFAFVPLYIHFMGVEAFGLIGFYMTLQATFLVLDMGLGTALSRELASVGPGAGERAQGRVLLRTLEAIYWTVAALVGLSIAAGAHWIARDWLNVRELPLTEVTHAVQLMGLAAFLRLPVSLYTGALMGLRRHDLLNAITSLGATLQGGGAVLVLWLVSATPVAFFLCLAGAFAVQVSLLAYVTWSQLASSGHRAYASYAALRNVLLFSVGVSGISVSSLILSQMDKFLLSRIISLEQFGYYSLTSTIASILLIVAYAIHGAVFPVFSSFAAHGRESDLVDFYHKSCQLLSLMLIPAGITVIFFAPELLYAYLQDRDLVEETQLLLRLLVSGTLMLSLMALPLALQLAYGWTKLTLYTNAIAVLVVAPLLLLVVGRYGAIGAAVVWNGLALNYLLIMINMMHRRLLPTEKRRWYLVDVALPLILSLALLAVARFLVPADAPVAVGLMSIALAFTLTFSLTAMVLPSTRIWSRQVLQTIGRGRHAIG